LTWADKFGSNLSYSFPNADGTTNQILRTNGSGSLTWADEFGSNLSYSFPNADGTANQVLQTDGSGSVSWSTIIGLPSTYTLPSTDGTAGQVLVTDGAGNLSWGAISNPIGTIQMWPTDTPPTGWLICDGSTFNADTFPDLANVLGGNSLPDLKGRFPLGVKFPVPVGQTPYPLNSTGGEATHILTIDEMPSHRHSIEYRTGSESGSNNNYSDLTDNGAPDDFTGYRGGTQAHNNMPPYLALHFIIKAN